MESNEKDTTQQPQPSSILTPEQRQSLRVILRIQGPEVAARKAVEWVGGKLRVSQGNIYVLTAQDGYWEYIDGIRYWHGNGITPRLSCIHPLSLLEREFGIRR